MQQAIPALRTYNSALIDLGMAGMRPFGRETSVKRLWDPVRRILTDPPPGRASFLSMYPSFESKKHDFPLCVHTSAGLLPAHETFIGAVSRHLPFCPDMNPNWSVDLQLEGASAVLSAVDGAMALSKTRGKVLGVASKSYHGPGGTSPGSMQNPRGRTFDQIFYPSPADFKDDKSAEAALSEWLHKNKDQLGAILVEPQSGSSASGYVWSDDVLRNFVHTASAWGITTISDEVMCGLGRHGRQSLWLAPCMEVDFDVYVVGKGLGGGVYPVAATIFKEHPGVLAHRHTFAGSSGASLLVASAALDMFEEMQENVKDIHATFELEFVSQARKLGYTVRGQGCLWAVALSPEMQKRIAADAASNGVLVYCANNSMLLTPALDMNVQDVKAGLKILLKVLSKFSSKRHVADRPAVESSFSIMHY